MTIKEVHVQLTNADILAESRPTRRRRTRKVGGAEDISVSTVQPTVSQNAPPTIPTVAPAVPTVASTVASTVAPAVPAVPTVAPAVPATPLVPTVAPPIVSTTTTPNVGGNRIHIKTRKRTHGTVLPPTPTPSKTLLGARILPVKRHAAPSKNKPVLRIQTTGGIRNDTEPVPTDTLPKRRRKFTERRIGISVRSFSKTRKAGKSIRRKVAAMPIADIRKALTDKGLLKGGKKTPERVLRALMIEYLTLNKD